MFVGNTILPAVDDQRMTRSRVSSLAHWYAAGAVKVLESLGDVVWVPSPQEAEILTESGAVPLVEKFRGTSQPLAWAGLGLQVNADSISVADVDARMPFPVANNRARDVVLLAVWRSPLGNNVTYSSKLGAALAVGYGSSAARDTADQIVSQNTGTLIASWRRLVTSDTQVDQAVDDSARQFGLAISHSPGAAKQLLKHGVPNASALTVYNECGHCHADAFMHWVSSRHSRSMDTLVTRLRHEDARCLPCHTSKLESTAARPSIAGRHTAVTCRGCHVDGQRPQDVCVTCHTALTDPHAMYVKSLNTVCGGRVHKVRGRAGPHECSIGRR